MPNTAIPITEVIVPADCWQEQPDAESVIQRAIEAASSMVDSDVGDAEIAVMLTDDVGIRTLNSNWRGIDKPTNVLSFPAADLPVHAPERPLGDLVICPDVLRAEAHEQGKSLRAHWAHLVVHGTLHLVGYDHENPSDANRMERREIAVLRRLGFPNPYRSS
jgi:probable rRNA maturation factor